MKHLLGLAVAGMAGLVVLAVGLGSGGPTAQADPSKIWVINSQVLQADDGALCGGVCDPTTVAGRATFEATLDTVQAHSSDALGNVKVSLCAPGCSLPPAAGDTWILVQTDGSGTAVALNGRGLGCTPVCDNVATQVPDATDHFYRTNAARSKPGSGLGLAILKQIIEAHGGRAWIDVAPDGGTVAGFELSAIPVGTV